MKLLGEMQYDGEKQDFWGDTYPTDISFSLMDVTEEDLRKLCATIELEVYTFGRLGYHNITEKSRHGSLDRIHSHLLSSPRGKNTVKLDHYKGSGLANIFIKGPKAEEIETKIKGLTSEESLENLALSQGGR